MADKYCIDCKWYSLELCTHNTCLREKFNLVYGDKIKPMCCTSERYSEASGICGYEGKYFEKK